MSSEGCISRQVGATSCRKFSLFLFIYFYNIHGKSLTGTAKEVTLGGLCFEVDFFEVVGSVLSVSHMLLRCKVAHSKASLDITTGRGS